MSLIIRRIISIIKVFTVAQDDSADPVSCNTERTKETERKQKEQLVSILVVYPNWTYHCLMAQNVYLDNLVVVTPCTCSSITLFRSVSGNVAMWNNTSCRGDSPFPGQH